MITGRRIREKQAAEASGLPLPSPQRQAHVPYHAHQAEVTALQGALAIAREENEALVAKVATLEQELAAARGEDEAPSPESSSGEQTASAESPKAKKTKAR